MVFELPHGRVGYILNLEIINQTPKAIYVSEIELRMQWKDGLFEWLRDPKETGRTVSYWVKKKDAVNVSLSPPRSIVFPDRSLSIRGT
jgi:hypothetical protein